MVDWLPLAPPAVAFNGIEEEGIPIDIDMDTLVEWGVLIVVGVGEVVEVGIV